jgi:hypothetical protein
VVSGNKNIDIAAAGMDKNRRGFLSGFLILCFNQIFDFIGMGIRCGEGII